MIKDWPPYERFWLGIIIGLLIGSMIVVILIQLFGGL